MARPLFDLKDRFHDLTNYAGKISNLHAGAKALATGLPVFNYPAPAAYVYDFFLSGFPQHPVVAYVSVVITCAVLLMGFALLAARREAPRTSGLVAAVLTTFVLGIPLWWTVDRANLEGLVWVISAAGVCAFLARRYMWSATLIGVAAAIKPFPLIFLALLVARRRIRETVIGVCVSGVLIVAALSALGGNPVTAFEDLRPGVDLYLSSYAEAFRAPSEQRVYHSLLDAAKEGIMAWKAKSLREKQLESMDNTLAFSGGPRPSLHELERLYVPFALCAVGVLAIVFARKPLLNQLTAASITVTLFPPASAEYTLLHLYVAACALFVFLAREAVQPRPKLPWRGIAGMLVCYALLFSPLSFLEMLGGIAKTGLLIALLILAAAVPLRSDLFDPAPDPAS